MTQQPRSLFLKKDEERRLMAGHLWIYSNEIDTKRSPLHAFSPGERVTIMNHQGKALGIGALNPQNLIAIRLLTSDPTEMIDVAFFEKRILNALAFRERFFEKPFYRLIYSESDGLPGLIVDRFGDVLVAQINTVGMDALTPLIVTALVQTIQPKSILLRGDSSGRQLENLPLVNHALYGEPPDEVEMEENGFRFMAPIAKGQKTGWFFDHRDNRLKLKNLVANRTVLDVFSYCGAWSIPAAGSGATKVTCVDSSELALAQVQKNAALNGVDSKIECVKGDAFKTLDRFAAERQKFDVIVLDPPGLIKKKKDVEAGLRAYLHLNQRAFELLNPNGILVSASCSQHLSQDDLNEIIRKASRQARRKTRVFYQGQQGADHPVHPAIHETRYLKATFVSVE